LRRLRRSELRQLLAHLRHLSAQHGDLFFELSPMPLCVGRKLLRSLFRVVGDFARLFLGVLNQRVDFARAIVE
jgi:hypothetical protein